MMLFSLGSIIQTPFGYLIKFLYNLTSSYGLSLILFAILVRLVLTPFTAKSKKNSMKMSRLQPQVQYLQKKYEKDQQKLGEEMRALYKAEGVSMGAGCLWSIVPLLIIFPLFYVVTQPLIWMLSNDDVTAWRVVEHLMITGDIDAGYEQLKAAAFIYNNPGEVNWILDKVGATPETYQGLNFSFLNIDLSQVPQWKLWDVDWAASGGVWNVIGGFLMPVLSGVSQMLSMFISQRMNNSIITDKNGVQDKEAAKNAQGKQSSKVMMWMMPVMSLIFGFSFPAALSLYWLASGVITTLIDVLLTKKYRKVYDAEDASKLLLAIEAERLEAERERIRAERRAANPDGITQNTSKKKLQQAKQKEQEAARAAAQKEYNEKKGIFTEEEKGNAPLSGIADRPFCKGRAYKADRYSNTEE